LQNAHPSGNFDLLSLKADIAGFALNSRLSGPSSRLQLEKNGCFAAVQYFNG